ncbi:uncharacterized protein LOC129739603 isoform X2 [Uranotaenia lowii]|uniref:uncharacterized protein LOC129739603 isoform X2 n=1 Tax=Uranotaenia lowii TaxID=190385 RepID=UPI002479E934|nr:uncharacterized protein LOC129739603 isoform X2 [Uranotaenia lowii]
MEKEKCGARSSAEALGLRVGRKICSASPWRTEAAIVAQMATPSSPTSEPMAINSSSNIRHGNVVRLHRGDASHTSDCSVLHQQQKQQLQHQHPHGNVMRRHRGNTHHTSDCSVLHHQQNNNNTISRTTTTSGTAMWCFAIGTTPATPPAAWEVLHQQQNNNNASSRTTTTPAAEQQQLQQQHGLAVECFGGNYEADSGTMHGSQ